MYAREYDNKVTIQCNAPSMKNLGQFWLEVQEYMDKGYKYDKELLTSIREVPAAMSFVRVTLINTDVEAPVVETKEEAPVVSDKPKTRKTTAKKPPVKK